MGTWTRVVRATSAAHSGESATAAAMRVLTSFVSAAAICGRAAKAAQTAAVASQVAAATSVSGIATSENGTVAVHSAAAALALMEAAHDHVEAVHAQLVAVTVGVKTGGSRVGGPNCASRIDGNRRRGTRCLPRFGPS